MKDSQVYIIHIRDCIARIEQYTSEGESDFFNDLKTQDAVIRNLEVMWESISLLPEEWKNQHPEMNWAGISGFRNILAHQYLGLELDSILVVSVTEYVEMVETKLVTGALVD
jgi:uncharacterized protein with HEPN domain